MKYAYLLRIFAISIAALTIYLPFANALEVGTLSKAVQAEEARLAARIGVALFDAKDGTRWAHRGDERFPLNSTHKSFSCAALLKQVDRRVLALENVISIERASLVTYSPVMEKTGAGTDASIMGRAKKRPPGIQASSSTVRSTNPSSANRPMSLTAAERDEKPKRPAMR